MPGGKYCHVSGGVVAFTKAMKHRTPLRSDGREHAQLAKMASVFASLIHAAISAASAPFRPVFESAARGPRPRETLLTGRSPNKSSTLLCATSCQAQRSKNLGMPQHHNTCKRGGSRET